MQNIPELFKQIMRNDTERAQIKSESVVSFASLKHYAWLRRERQDYRQAAEAMLHWNTNKGNTA